MVMAIYFLCDFLVVSDFQVIGPLHVSYHIGGHLVHPYPDFC